MIGAGFAAFAGLLAVLVHPLAPFAALFLAIIAFWMARSSYLSLILFVIVLFTRPADFLPQLGVFQPAKLLAMSSLGLFLIIRLLRGQFGVARCPQNAWMGALTLVVLLSSVAGTHPGQSLGLFKESFVKIVLLFALIVHLVDSTSRAVSFQVVLGVLAGTLGGYATLSKATGGATIEGSRAALVGLLGDPNDLALTILMATPFLIAASVRTEGARRWGFATLALFAVLGIVSTLSRGGLLGLGAGTYVLLRSFGLKRIYIALGMTPAVLALVLASGLSERESGAVGAAEIDESAQGRLDAWVAGGRMLAARPLLGVGFERFADNFPNYATSHFFFERHEAHNSYIKVAAETGILGFVPFMALIGLSGRASLRLRGRASSAQGTARALCEAAPACLAGFCVAAFFLSQCWGWFFYVLFSHLAASERTI